MSSDDERESCETCRSRIPCKPEDGIYLYSKSFDAIKRSATTDCSICKLLVQAIQTHIPSDKRNDGVFSGYGTNPWIKLYRDQKVQGSFDIWLSDQRQQVFAGELTARQISGNTASDQSLNMAISWIEKCVVSHRLCGNGSKQPLPRRVLDLDSRSLTSDEVYLFLASNELARYACLSYCWGDPQIIPKTTTENLDERCRGILVSTLPTTFRHAIEFTRKLGLRFLWIDSFCIVQNDLADWRQESAQMANIYRNSYVTLAAAKSADVQGGMFSTTGPEYSLTPLTFTDYRGKLINGYTRLSITHDLDWKLMNEVEDLPLFRRGWAFQERLLAARVLNFCSQELVMECRTDTVCECSSRSGLKERRPKIDFEESLSQYGARRGWIDLVQNYSRLQLTFELDKLPAISGIAQLFQTYELGVYLAGLWSNVLIELLHWAAQTPGNRPGQWRAPSWSWASIDALIIFDYSADGGDISEQYLGVIDFHGKAMDEDSTGRVVSGYLAIAGMLYDDFKHSASEMNLTGQSYWGSGFSFDATAALKAFNSDPSTPLFWMMISFIDAPHLPEPPRSSFLILKQTEKKIETVPDLNIGTIKEKVKSGNCLIPYAMERVGICTLKGEEHEKLRDGKYPGIKPGKRTVVVII